MASYVALGFKAVKMKVGRGDLKSEEARNGELVVPTTPGLGFRFREEALNQYAAGPWA